LCLAEENKPDQISKEVQTLLQRRIELQADQTKLVTLVVTSFVDSLVPGRGNGIAVPSQLDKVIDGDYHDPLVWDTLARLGFYREFMRSVSVYGLWWYACSRLIVISIDSMAATLKQAAPL
jgi:hypothetical protein